MEIHELNTFSGTLGSGDYFATDNGNDTSKVSAEAMFAPLNARIDNIIAGPASSAQEVIDARLGADGVTYPSLGDAIRNQVSGLKSDFSDIALLNENDVPLNFESKTGYIDVNGSLNTYNNVWGATIQIESGYEYILNYRSYYGMCEVVYYDSSDNFISGTASHNTDDHFVEKLTIPANAKSMMIQAYGRTDTIYTNYSLSKADGYVLKSQDSIDLSSNILEQVTEETLDRIELSFASATGYIDISGNLNTYSNMWKDEISVVAGEKYYLDYRAYFGMCEMVFYNADNVFLSGVLNHNSDNGYYKNVEITVPVGATKAIVQEFATSAQLAKETYVLKKYSGNYVVKSKLAGKMIAYNGDSIAESRLRGYGVNGGSYPHIISELTNSQYNNRAVGGGILASVAPQGVTPPHFIVSDITNMPNDADLICLEGGLNDFYDNVPLGSYDENDYTGTVDTTTVCGALESIFRQSIAKWVGKPICFIFVHRCYGTKVANTAGYTYQEMREKMIGICHKYAIPFYDAYTESGLNAYNDIQNTNFLTANGTGTPDGTHPNEAGYRAYYVPQILALFESIIN